MLPKAPVKRTAVSTLVSLYMILVGVVFACGFFAIVASFAAPRSTNALNTATNGLAYGVAVILLLLLFFLVTGLAMFQSRRWAYLVTTVLHLFMLGAGILASSLVTTLPVQATSSATDPNIGRTVQYGLELYGVGLAVWGLIIFILLCFNPATRRLFGYPMRSSAPPPNMTRAPGTFAGALAGTLALFLGVAGIFGWLLLLLPPTSSTNTTTTNVITKSLHALSSGSFSLGAAFILLAYVVTPIGNTIAGSGLLRLKPWAFRVVIAFTILQAVYIVYAQAIFTNNFGQPSALLLACQRPSRRPLFSFSRWLIARHACVPHRIHPTALSPTRHWISPRKSRTSYPPGGRDVSRPYIADTACRVRFGAGMPLIASTGSTV